MHNGNEWYWNLNLHRDKLTLVNSSLNDGKNAPTKSAFYTSAVLTDVGICVGMRNVNLNSENQTCLHAAHKIPNCYDNLNVVGQRNKQTWSAAYDRMRYSSLTDPTMSVLRSPLSNIDLQATAADFPPKTYPYYDKWNELGAIKPASTVSPKNCCWNCEFPSVKVEADSNPFHLFGDNSKYSMIDFKNDQKIDNHCPCNATHSIPSIAETTHATLNDPCNLHKSFGSNFYMPSPMQQISSKCCTNTVDMKCMNMSTNDVAIASHHLHQHHHHHLFNVLNGHTNYNSLPMGGYPSTNFASPSSFTKVLTPSLSTATTAIPTPTSTAQDNIALQNNHLAPPKKKWIRNFMQSKFLFSFFIIFFFFLSLVIYSFLIFASPYIFISLVQFSVS